MAVPPEPANDHSNWTGPLHQCRCDCGNWSYEVFLLDGWARLVCVKCEKDHTDIFFNGPTRPT